MRGKERFSAPGNVPIRKPRGWVRVRFKDSGGVRRIPETGMTTMRSCLMRRRCRGEALSHASAKEPILSRLERISHWFGLLRRLAQRRSLAEPEQQCQIHKRDGA